MLILKTPFSPVNQSIYAGEIEKKVAAWFFDLCATTLDKTIFTGEKGLSLSDAPIVDFSKKIMYFARQITEMKSRPASC
jgi:hypothetical protein